MSNTSSNSKEDGGDAYSIAPQTVAALSNPAIGAAQYWNLNTSAFGSAGFTAAWGFATGHGVTIGLVDEGVNYTHLDLAASYDTSIDFDPRDDISDARPDTAAEQHGTEVAGIIAGSGANDFGTIGAAPDAIITASYLRYGSAFSMADLGQVMAHQSAYDVSNNSWGFTSAFADNFNNSYLDDLSAAIENAAATGRGGLGTAMVFAAGNGKLTLDGQNIGDNSNFHNLSNNRFSIAVGASDAAGKSAFFSSPGANILISAPGLGLLTTNGLEDGATSSTYVSGTSFAAPMVSSAIALMLEANPNLGYRDIQEILAISADPSRSGTALTNGAGNVNGGGLMFDREMGFGILNALSAVSLARSWTSQHTAANEQHLGASFALPDSTDSSCQTLTLDLANAGTDGFSLDFVQLTLALADSDLNDLRIELTSPEGTTCLIAPNLHAAGGRTTLDFTFSSVATWGENPYGTWTLALSHPAPVDGFSVLGADLDLYGDCTTADGDYYFTASFARLVGADPGRANITDSDGGIDRLNFAAAAGAVNVDLTGLAANSIGKVSFTLDGTFENVFGSIHDDRIGGSDDVNSLNGDFGNDWIAALGGDDFLTGGAGNDTLIGGAGANSLDGGDGFDTVAYEHAVVLDFVTGNHTGDAAGDLFAHIEAFALSGEDDSFFGSLAAVDERVYGGGGNDYLDGGAGNDLLDGGTGADSLVGGEGDDTFVVDSQSDTVSELFGEGTDTVRSSITYTLGDNVENLVLTGTARDGFGNAAANVMSGDAQNNRLYGLGGNDILKGGSGKDSLYGGSGDDTLVGGSGQDALTGGAGRDVFVFSSAGESKASARDQITDFQVGYDRIDLSGGDANSRSATHDSYRFIGTHAFTHHAGELQIRHSGNTTVVLADRDGNGQADFAITFKGDLHLHAGDFIL